MAVVQASPRRAWTAAAVSIVMWATAFPAIRAAVRSYDPTTLTTARLVVASVCLAVVAPLVHVPRPRLRDAPLLVLCGLLGMAGYQLLLNWGEETVAAGTASLLVAGAPAYSVVLAALVLHEPLTARRIRGMGLALLGAAMIALGSGGRLHLELGTLLVIGAALALGTYHVAHRPLLVRYPAVAVVCYATWSASLLTLPLLATVSAPFAEADAGSMAAVAFLGVGPSAIAFVTWAYAVHRLGVSAAATSLYLVPAVALPVAGLTLGEVPHAIELAGGALAIAGVAAANRRPRPATAAADAVTPAR